MKNIITNIAFENFLPFHNEELFFEKDQEGVYLFIAENSSGKSAFFKSLQYVFFGKASDGKSKIPIHELINTDGIKNKNFNASVSISLNEVRDDEEDMITQITRKITFTGNKDISFTDLNANYFKEDLEIIRNNEVMTQEDAKMFLRANFPPHLKEYYMVDGEEVSLWRGMINDALKSESEDTDEVLRNKIKASIERILDLPFLDKGSKITEKIYNSISEDRTKALKNKSQSEDAATKLDEVNTHIKMFERQNEEADELIKHNIDEQGKFEAKLQGTEELKTTIENLKNDRNDLEELEEIYLQEIDGLKEMNKNVWTINAARCLSDKYEDNKNELTKLISLQRKYEKNGEDKRKYSQIIDKKICPECNQGLNQDKIDSYELKYKEIKDTNLKSYTPAIEILNKTQNEIEPIIKNSIPLKTHLVKQFTITGKSELDIESKKDAIKKWEADIPKGGTSDIEQWGRDLNSIKQEIEKQKNIKKQNDIDSRDYYEDKIKFENMLKNSKTDLTLDKKFEVSEKLNSLFKRTYQNYREDCRFNLQKDSTETFNKINHTWKDVSLGINRDFGLKLDRKEFPSASMGVGFLIAVSLIFSLFKNAKNLNIPIIYDSIFTSLDTTHSEKLIDFLPDLTHQSFLFVMPGEIDMDFINKNINNRVIYTKKIQNETGTNAKFIGYK